ncbi:MAG: ATP-binding cassette domain-containing protein [Oleispira sp.]|nr:ATP-binding cassette domain-containing protein [Oleispira sp.]
MIEFNQVSLHRGIKPLLKHADLRIHDGQKLALIGPNGAGKSSLFALLLGELGVEEGDLYLPTGWRIAHMAQEVEASQRCAVDYVIDGDKTYRQIEHGIETATCDNELANWHSKMDAHNGYNIKVQAEQLLHGLGFKQSDMTKPVSGFSGGWRIRLNLAQALMTPSDLLLLDEPTNHLDLDATLWLEQWLNRYQGTLLFISHDRDFIDGVADHIVHLHQLLLTSYPGNYSAYERIRAERLAQQQVMHDKQQVRIAEIEKFVTRFKAKASKAKQAQSRVKELERMELIAPAHVDSPFSFAFACADKVSTPLLNLENADIGYQIKDDEALAILHKQNVSLVPGHRIGLLGANGAGKSTLIKTLCEELPQLSGKRHEGEHLKLGYYAQHQLETLDVKASPMLMIQRITPSATDQEVRNFLGGFDFRGDKALDICEPFSGGEKARLALALVAWQKPNLLIMDEPTNHLDIEMREALTMALQTFAGAIVIVSHDRHLLKATVDEYWLVEDGKVQSFDGDLHDYHKHVQAKQADSNSVSGTGQLASNPNSADNVSDESSNKATGISAQDRKEQKRLDAERRKRLAPMRKELHKLEGCMEKLQSTLETCENQLSDTALYEADRKADLQKILQQQGDAKSELEEVEMKWMDLSEKMEAAE